MKDSSDIAREAADITPLSSDLGQLVTARLLGRRLMRRIQRGFNFIAAFNTALLALGMRRFGFRTWSAWSPPEYMSFLEENGWCCSGSEIIPASVDIVFVVAK